jgi:hypothetical protein
MLHNSCQCRLRATPEAKKEHSRNMTGASNLMLATGDHNEHKAIGGPRPVAH